MTADDEHCAEGSLAERLRHRFERLAERDLDEATRAKCVALEVALIALEVLEARADSEEALLLAVRIRAAELGRQIAELGIESLGYYALPAADPARQHNELPVTALGAQDALAELIRYLDAGFAEHRDRLAEDLGIIFSADERLRER
jgi:hypothetical protein